MVQFKVKTDSATDEELEQALETVADHNMEITKNNSGLEVHDYDITVRNDGGVTLVLSSEASVSVQEAQELADALEQLERGLKTHSQLEDVSSVVE